MKILRVLMMSFAVVALVSTGFLGCAGKQEAGEGGMEAQQPAMEEMGKPSMEEEGGRMMAEAPPGPTEQPEKVEPVRPELALDDVHYAFDSYEILPDQAPVLEKNAGWIKDNPDVVVTIEGHCDERGTVEYNLALGERRAKAARDYLVALGVDASRLKTISYGKSKPVDTASTEAAWAKNRRAHFVVQ